MQLYNETIRPDPEVMGVENYHLHLRYKEHFGCFAQKIRLIEVFYETNPRFNEKISRSQVPLYHHHHPSFADHRVKMQTVFPLTLLVIKK